MYIIKQLSMCLQAVENIMLITFGSLNQSVMLSMLINLTKLTLFFCILLEGVFML